MTSNDSQHDVLS